MTYPLCARKFLLHFGVVGSFPQFSQGKIEDPFVQRSICQPDQKVSYMILLESPYNLASGLTSVNSLSRFALKWALVGGAITYNKNLRPILTAQNHTIQQF